MQDLFVVDNVSFSSRSESIIKNVSLTIKQGSVSCLVGKSGCGKSTLLKLIAGILVPTSGKVFFEGKNIFNMSKAESKMFRKRASFVFQDSALWENQTIEQNLNLPLQVQNPKMSYEECKEKINDICKIVGFSRSLSLRPVDLSTGEQKLIAFARGIINNPEILFLDECTESLDAHSVDRVLSILCNYVLQKKTIIYISHNKNFVDFITKAGVISGGNFVFNIESGSLKRTSDYEI